MDDNVMAKYTTEASEARHYVQYDQGKNQGRIQNFCEQFVGFVVCALFFVLICILASTTHKGSDNCSIASPGIRKNSYITKFMRVDFWF